MEVRHTTCKMAQKWQIPEDKNSDRVRPRFDFCPYCGKEGYYKIPHLYENCIYCGINRILILGQHEQATEID